MGGSKHGESSNQAGWLRFLDEHKPTGSRACITIPQFMVVNQFSNNTGLSP